MEVMVMNTLASCWMSYLQDRMAVMAAVAPSHNLRLHRYI
jgi:hypothetical protein